MQVKRVEARLVAVMMFELMCSYENNWNWRGLNGGIVHGLAISIEDKQVQHVQIDK